jgi:hypothetical protein
VRSATSSDPVGPTGAEGPLCVPGATARQWPRRGEESSGCASSTLMREFAHVMGREVVCSEAVGHAQR